MTEQSPEQRILDELVRAARNDFTSDIDAHALERRLHQRWLAEVAREPSRKGPLLRWAPMALAAVFVLVAGIAGIRHLMIHEGVSTRAPVARSSEGGQLQVGQLVVTQALPVTISHAGKATWTLAPHGQARLVAFSPCLTLGLEAGRIDADVLPSTQVEAFAIETPTYRIVVHGTRFSVELGAGELRVEVSSGAVVVQRRGQTGSNARSLLTAPQSLTFPLRETAVAPSTAPRLPLPSIAHARSRATASTSVAPTAPSASPSAVAAELPQHPTAIEQETALDVVRAAAARCFAQSAAADAESHSEVRVRVETQLTVSLSASGALQEISFMPPVPPEIADCTSRETNGWSATPSRLGATASRAIILTR